MYFNSARHEKMYNELCEKIDEWDRDRKRLFYVLSCDLMYRYIENCYNFAEECIEPTALDAGWQTSGSRLLTLVAFSMFNGSDEFKVNLRKIVGTLDDENLNIVINVLKM